MKTKTEKILLALKILALLGGIGYSIECGIQILLFVASFINPDWAKHVYATNQSLFGLRQYNIWFFINSMSLVITLSGLKALIWYVVFDLLLKLKLQNPFSMDVAKKIEFISYLLVSVWGIGFIAKEYIQWLSKNTSLELTGIRIGGEYLFIAGIVFIISQIFKRGIEIQDENQLTV